MCGIAGVLTSSGEAARVEPAIAAMQTAVRHRGPDDTGLWCSPAGHAAFAHTRLSILDLTAAGRQPMSIAGGRFTITYNGEIYNFRELRRSLEQRGVQFETRTDTEVILRAYEANGPACVETLRGMFAFALWDEQERTCLIARDRFGIKPFYYHAGKDRLVFASEVRALLASGLVPAELGPLGLYGYFRTGSVPEPNTLLRDVYCLEAGHYAVWRNGALTTRQYWDVRFEASPAAASDDVAATRRALLDSVAHHFISDTPVGVFLSGGVDSSALVALARATGQSDLRTFSITFPGWADDEGAVARRTATHFGTAHSEWPMDATAARDLFRLSMRASDQPSIDGLNTFAVSKLARESGVKVVLSGLGGDELFGGYPSFTEVPRLAAWNHRLSYAGPLRGAVGRRLETSSSDPKWRRLGDLLGQSPDLSTAYESFRAVYTRAEALTLVEKYSGVALDAGRSGAVVARMSDPTERDGVSRLELTRYMRNQLLRDSDAMSMAWGLELRVPFLDCEVVDALSAVPARRRLQPHKRFLLQAVPEVPAWVAGQPKRGFVFPFRRWLDEEWREIFAELDRTSPVPGETWSRKLCVFVLERWLERLGQATDE